MALIGQEVVGRARDRDPRARSRCLSALSPEPALSGPIAWNARSIRRPTSTTSTRAAARPAATSRTPRSPRPSTTRSRVSPGWRPRPAPGNGGVRWPSRAPTSGSRSRSTWSAPATTRSRTGGSSWRRTARRSWPVPRRPRTTAGPCWPPRPTARARWGWPSARPSRTPRRARTPSTPWGRSSTTCCSTRRSSARRRSSRWGWPANRPTSSSAAPVAGPTSPGSPSRSSGATCARGRRTGSSPSSPRRPRA